MTGVGNGIGKEEKAAVRLAVTTSTTEITTTTSTTTAPKTTTAITAAVSTTEPQITTAVTCSSTEQGLGETTTPTTTTEQTTAADTTVQMATTSTAATTTAPVPTEPCHGQTSGDYIYVNGFGWVFNEGGGGYGEINYDMYCNGQYNRILWITVNAVFTVFYSYVFLLTDAIRIVISVSPM